MSNILTVPVSGAIYFSDGVAGSSTIPNLSAGVALKYDNSAGLNITSFASAASASDRFSIDGASGRLFSVSDSLTGSIFSVNDAAGLPIIEVESNLIDKITMGTYGSNALVVNDTKVGIGTATPAEKLSVVGNTTVTGFISASQYFGLQSALSGAAALVGGNTLGTNLLIGTNDNFNLNLETGGTTKMTVTSAGNVGIGTTTASAKLQIIHDASTNPIDIRRTGFLDSQLFTISNLGDITGGAAVFTPKLGHQVPALTVTGNGTFPVAIFQTGNVGIGTSTPTAKLDIADTTLASSGGLSGSALNITQTWNTTGNPTAIKLNVTNTTSGTDSNLLDLQVGSSPVFTIKKSGQVVGINGSVAAPTYGFFDSNWGSGFSGWYKSADMIACSVAGGTQTAFSVSHVGLKIATAIPLGWSASTGLATLDTILLRDGAAGILAQRNGVNPQSFRVYSTYTDASNYERFFINTNVGATSATQIGLSAAGTGQNRDLELVAGGANRWKFGTDNFLVGGYGGGIQLRYGTIGSPYDYPYYQLNLYSLGTEAVVTAGQYIPLSLGGGAQRQWQFAVTGHLLSLNDGAYDIGASGANRPRNIYQTGVIYASGGNSNLWNNTFTTVNASSANYILDGGNTKGANLLVGTNDNFNLNLETAGTTRMTVTSAGLVGIGTTNPLYTLDVNGAIGTSYSGIKLGDPIYSIDVSVANSIAYKSSLNHIFYGASTELMRLVYPGNLGLGTVNPTAKLDIVDTNLAGSGVLSGSILNLTQTWATSGSPTAIKLNVTNTNSGAASNLLDLQVDGSNRFRVDKDGVTTVFGTFNTCTLKITQIGSNQTNGFGPFGANAILAYANGTRTMLLGYGGGYTDLRLTAGHRFGWTSDAFSAAAALDTMFTRKSAANIRLGDVDAAVPVAQTLSVQSVVAGTTNTAGTNFTIAGSQGTGTGAGGSIIFQTAPAGSSGTAQNGLSAALTIDSDRNITIGGPYNDFSFKVPAGGGSRSFSIIDGVNRVFQTSTSGLVSLGYIAMGASTPNPDIFLQRDAANILALRNGVNPQSFRVYSTYTDASNYERFFINTNVGATSATQIGLSAAGTGQNRNLEVVTGGNTRMTVTSAGNVSIGVVNDNYMLSIQNPSIAAGSASRLVISKPATTATETISEAVWGGDFGNSFRIQQTGYVTNTSGLPNHSAIFGVYNQNGILIGAGGTSDLYAQFSTSIDKRFSIYSTLNNSFTNYERLSFKPQSGGAFLIMSEAAGTGSYRDIEIQNGGSTRIDITSGGNIGIGTTNPTSLLHLRGGTSPTLKLEGFDAGATNLYPAISFHSNNSQGNYESARIEGYGYNPGGFNNLNFYINNGSGVLSRMWQMDSSGNIVQNPGAFSADMPGSGIIFTSKATGGTGLRTIKITACASTGHPGESLRLQAGDANYAATGGLNFGGKIFVYGGKAVTANATPKDGDVILAHDGTGAIGGVGVGTSTPLARLDIADTTFAGSSALSGSALNITQTWNTTGNPTAITLNVTNSASGSTSNLLDLQVGGSSKFKVDKNGLTTMSSALYVDGGQSALTSSYLQLANSAGRIIFNSNIIHVQTATGLGWFDLPLWRDAAGILAQRNGVNPQSFRVYSTYTDASNYERFFINTNVGSTSATQIGLSAAGTGQNRNLEFVAGGSTKMTIASGGTVSAAGTGVFGTLYSTSGNISGPSDVGIAIGAGYQTMIKARNGAIVAVFDNQNPPVLSLRNGTALGWTNGEPGADINTMTLSLYKDGNDVFAQRRGINPQAFRLYNTYTDPVSAFERLNIKWDTNVLKIGTEKGSVGGTARDLVLETDATERARVLSTGNILVKDSLELNTLAPLIGTVKPVLTVYRSGSGGDGCSILCKRDGGQEIGDLRFSGTAAAPDFGINLRHNYTAQSNLATFTQTTAGRGSILFGTFNGLNSATLSIFNSSAAQNTTGLILGNNSTSVNSNIDIVFQSYTADPHAIIRGVYHGGTKFGSLAFFTANGSTPVEALRITQTGSVGIGTSTPVARLDIADTTLAGSGALSGSALNITQTWNTTGNPTAITLNVTNSASGAASNLLDLQVGGNSKFKVDKNGSVLINSTIYGTTYIGVGSPNHGALYNRKLIIDDNTYVTAAGAAFGSNGWGFYSLNGYSFNISTNTLFYIQNTGITLSTLVEQRNGVNPQTFRIYNTYTDPVSAFERLNIKWDTNVIKIGTEKGSTGGAARAMEFQTDGTTRWSISSAGNLLAGADNTYDIGASGATRPRDIFVGRNLTIANAVSIGNTLDVTGSFYLRTGPVLKAVLVTGVTNGVIKITDSTENDFNRLQFGGTTSSFPAIKRSGAALQVRLADDSGYAALETAGVTVTGTVSAAGDFAVATSLQGVILVSPNSTRWRITVNDNGSLQTTAL